MKKLALISLFAAVALAAFAQSSDLGGGGGFQLSGTLSMNLINNFLTSTASMDGVDGLSYLQLNPSLKDGPFGFDSELAVGPGNSVNLRYAYGYADFLGGRVHTALGKFIDPDTFALNSFFVGGSDGPGSFGNPALVNAQGNTGNGIDGVQLKLSPIKNLLVGYVLPYNSADTVDMSLKRSSVDLSYTVEKEVQVVLGYSLGHTGVADLATPVLNRDQNKAYMIANVLVSDSLVLGARYELDHDVSHWQVISNNAYLTVGEKLADFSVGGDVGLYFPRGASAGYEILGTTSYTVRSVLPSVDLQPVLSVSYVSRTYQESAYPSINFNPQLRLLLGKSQHELAVGYSGTYDFDSRRVIVSQLNVLMQVYF
jgi:hypothetical protein